MIQEVNHIVNTIGKSWKKPVPRNTKMYDRVSMFHKKNRIIETYLGSYTKGGRSVLDFSCGTGSFIELMRYYGNKVMGTEVDYFQFLKSQSLPHIDHDGNDVPYPFEDDSYDLVTSIGAITFLDIPFDVVLDEFFRIARKEVFVVVNNGHILERNLDLLKSYEKEGWERTVDNHTAYGWHVA